VAGVLLGSNSPAVTKTRERERERERNQGEKKMTGGTRTSVRERGRGRGAGPVRVVVGLVLPGLAQWLALFFFFCSVSFSIFCF
jgi:hypothetical protein